MLTHSLPAVQKDEGLSLKEEEEDEIRTDHMTHSAFKKNAL